MNYLLDVNALVAWGWADHPDYDRVARWIAGRRAIRSSSLFTSAIPQMGFVRVSVQRSGGQLTPEETGKRLQSMLAALGAAHHFLVDDQTCFAWPAWCRGASRTTDAHLVTL